MRHPDMEQVGGPAAGHPDEGTIHAWLDGALSESETAGLEAHLAHCAGCREAVAEARGLMAASSRVLRALDFGPGGVGDRPVESRAGGAGGAGGAGATGDEGLPSGAPELLPEPPALPVEPLPDDVRPITSARNASGVRRRRWRVPAVAAVAVMAIGTSLVLWEQGSAGRIGDAVASSAPADARGADLPAPPLAAAPVAPVASGDAGLAGASRAGATRTERAAERPPVPSSDAAAAAAAGAAAGAASLEQQLGARNSALATAAVSAQSQLADATPAAVVGPVISGRVLTRRDGQPVPDAIVDMADLARSTTTDSLGRFRLAGVPPGTHRAVIRGEGLEPQQLALQVVPSGDSAVVVALAPRQQAESAAERRLAGGGTVSSAGAPIAIPAPVPLPAAKATGETRQAAVASAAPAVPQPPTPPAAIQRLIGCYRLELSGTTSDGRDVAERTLPGWLELRAGAAARTGGWLAVAGPASSRPTPRTGWRLTADREVEVIWPAADGEQDVLLHLTGSGEVLVGTAAIARQGVGGAAGAGEAEVASVVAVRSVCSPGAPGAPRSP